MRTDKETGDRDPYTNVPTREEDAGRKMVKDAIRTTLFVVSNCDDPDNHEAILESVLFALDETGWDDLEATQSTALCHNLNYDPETRA